MIDQGVDHWHHFVGLVLVTFLATFQERASRNAPIIMVFMALPGTVLHEISHYLVAAVTGGRPANFTIIPRRSDAGQDERGRRLWTLGSVTLRNPGVFSAFPSGLAPLTLNLPAWYFYKYWFLWFPRGLLPTLELYLIISIICASSIPSIQDVRVAISSPLGVFLYAAVTLLLFQHRAQLIFPLL